MSRPTGEPYTDNLGNVPQQTNPDIKSKPKEHSNGSRNITLYMPQWRAILNEPPDTYGEGFIEVGPHRLTPRWKDIPYKIIPAADSGFLVSGLGIPLPRIFDRAALDYGLPFPHAEALRWAALASIDAIGSVGGLWNTETRYVVRKYVSTYTVTEEEHLEADTSLYWNDWKRHGSASPVGCPVPEKKE